MICAGNKISQDNYLGVLFGECSFPYGFSHHLGNVPTISGTSSPSKKKNRFLEGII
jgi:hypothetical protein